MIIKILISYLLGSINFSWIVGRILKLNIEGYGDENLGATNLYYAITEKYSKTLAISSFLLGGLLDALKAFIPTVLFGPFIGSFAVLGHCFSVFSIVITKKVPSGVGLASIIGWILGNSLEVMIPMVLLVLLMFLVGLPLFYDTFRIERGHSYTLFATVVVVLIYLLFWSPPEEVVYGIFVIAVSSSFARFLRLRNLIKRLIKQS